MVVNMTEPNTTAVQYMLTTVDNPYNPFTHYKEWYAFDEQKGYHSTALLGRVVRSSDELSLALQLKAIDDAIDEIVNENVSGMHRKVADPKSTNS
jgi:hypothetical protein